MNLKPLFCRAGNKTLMADNIISLMPKHSIYVEPFVGGGGVYFKKPPVELDVINDLDKVLYDGYKLVERVSTNPDKYKKTLDTIPKLSAFLKSKITTPEDRLTEIIVRHCNGFSGTFITCKSGKVWREANPYSKLEKITLYKKRMKNTIILNQDWEKVIKETDTEDTLFYLDPPYEGSGTIYKNSEMDYNNLADVLSKIKGKFLMSINDSRNIRKIFRNFNIQKVKLATFAPKNPTKKQGKIGTKKRIELIIKNY